MVSSVQDIMTADIDGLTVTDARAQLRDVSKAAAEQNNIAAYSKLRDMRLRVSKKMWSEPPADYEADASEPADLFADNPVHTIPEIAAGDLTVDHIRSAIYHHGTLIVRGLIGHARADELRQDIANCMNEFDDYHAGNKDRDYHYYNPKFGADYDVPKNMKFLRMSGSFRTAMSPVMMHKLMSMYESIGLRKLLEEYFNADAYISFKKWVLRQNEPLKMESDWHQDGAFMGADIKTLNTWIALTECGPGTDKCAMDIVSKRLTKIVPTGTDGANFDWSVSAKYVSENLPVQKPSFKPGDAVLFDQFNLHRTAYDATFTGERYAIETWFFAGDGYAPDQIPIVW